MNKLLTVSPSPHEYSKESTKKLMYGVVIALAPAMLATIWFFGSHPGNVSFSNILCYL